jgi:hypothetical protein
MLQTINTPTKLAAKDVVSCLVCGETANTKIGLSNYYNDNNNENNTEEEVDIDTLSPDEIRQESMRRLERLPVDKNALKSSSRKRRKKLLEQDFMASNWDHAVSLSIGSTQSVRCDKFISCVERNAIPYVAACLRYGVDVDWINEYGQTALYVAVWREYKEIVELLLQYGSNPSIVTNGGSTIPRLCQANGRDDIMDLILRYHSTFEDTNYLDRYVDLKGLGDSAISPKAVTTLIPDFSDHPGAGSFIIDETISNEAINILVRLHRTLPGDQNQKQKKNSILCSDRSYYCDAEGTVCALLKQVLERSNLVKGKPGEIKVYPYMRFLHYSKPGTILAPHVDLCRVDPFSSDQELRSTHTFILYLTDCHTGGETCLLGEVSGEGREVCLAKVEPRQGRLLVFPHVTPHEGLEVVDVPKILLRGELQL